MWSGGSDVIIILVLFSLDGTKKEGEEKLLNETWHSLIKADLDVSSLTALYMFQCSHTMGSQTVEV